MKRRIISWEDVQVLSAYLQDALVLLHDMTFLEEEGRFIGVFNRFKWEDVVDPAVQSYERTLSALTIEKVTRVQRYKIDMYRRTLILELLTITAMEGGLQMTFAEDRRIYIETESEEYCLEDFGQAWPASSCPVHKEEGGGD